MRTLQHFIVRAQVLKLYRRILSSCRKVDDPALQRELRQWARSEFESRREVEDLEQIKYLLRNGQSQARTLEGSLKLSSPRIEDDEY